MPHEQNASFDKALFVSTQYMRTFFCSCEDLCFWTLVRFLEFRILEVEF